MLQIPDAITFYFLPFFPMIKESLQKVQEFFWILTVRLYDCSFVGSEMAFLNLNVTSLVKNIRQIYVYIQIQIFGTSLTKTICQSISAWGCWVRPLSWCLRKSSKACLLLHIFRLLSHPCSFMTFLTCKFLDKSAFRFIYHRFLLIYEVWCNLSCVNISRSDA